MLDTLAREEKEKLGLSQFLEAFKEIFKEYKGLPPKRAHIPLQTGSDLVCLKPYKYPHYQKSEVGRLVTEMLTAGVIRPSNNPFSSPVVLVKKK